MFGKSQLDRIGFLKSRVRPSGTFTGLILAIVVGLVAGLGAVAFRWLITSFKLLFFDGGSQLLSFLGDYYVILIPVAGGLLVGPLIYFFAREAKGHGVPEVIEAVALRGGRITTSRLGCQGTGICPVHWQRWLSWPRGPHCADRIFLRIGNRPVAEAT